MFLEPGHYTVRMEGVSTWYEQCFGTEFKSLLAHGADGALEFLTSLFLLAVDLLNLNNRKLLESVDISWGLSLLLSAHFQYSPQNFFVKTSRGTEVLREISSKVVRIETIELR